MKPTVLLFSLFACVFLRAQEPPRYLEVEVSWQPPGGDLRRQKGQLWLENAELNVLRIQDDGTAEPARYNSRRLTPRSPGDVAIRRDGSHRDHPRFKLTLHGTPQLIHFPEDRLPVIPQEASSADAMRETLEENPMDRELDALFGEGDGPGDLLADPDARDPLVREGLRLEVDDPDARHEIPFSRLREIRFLRAGDGYRFETYTGRYVQYSRSGKGDEGRVRLEGATFFGGDGRERFDAGGFMRDGTIAMAASLSNLDFLEDVSVRGLGRDPDLEEVPRYYRRTPVLVIYTPDLRRIREVVRFPWGVGSASHILFGEDDAIHLLVRPGPHTETFFQSLPQKQVVGDPLGGQPHSYLFRVAPDRSGIDWGVKFENLSISPSPYPGNRLLLRSGSFSRLLDQRTGRMEEGPVVQRVGGGRLHDQFVHPETGAFFMGGENHSGTGLEPWRSPWLRKYSPDGKIEWTAYDWTGPVVGVAFLRLVSDSAVMGVSMGGDGNLLLRGWSDGGNSVFTRQPYDLREPVPMGGWCASIWGASVLSVPYLIRMDPDTQEVYGVTRYNSYLPTKNKPNSITIRDVTTTAGGDVVLTGQSAFGFVETHDAWVTPWIHEYRENEFATAKGGTFFTVFTPDMKRARLATLLPGVHHPQFATRGDRVLLFGEAAPSSNSYGREYPTLLENPLQDFGGGSHDAYVMLIHTRGEPRPVQLPKWTWGKRAGER